MTQHCERCGSECLSTSMSMFNTQIICWDCLETEKEHPQYSDAVGAEITAIRNGDYNFPGIGLPEDLK